MRALDDELGLDPGPIPPDFDAPAVSAFVDVGLAAPSADVDRWLVENFLRPRAYAVLASAEGVGKSYARCELAIRLATGTGALFNHYAIPEPCRVMLVDEENGADEELRREDDVLDTLGLPREALTGRYFRTSYAGMNLNNPERQAWLRREIDSLEPDLLILDTGGSMTADEWGGPLKEAVRYIRTLPCAVLVNVHLTKPPRDNHGRQHGSSLADIMGQWTRSADVVAMMADLGADRARWTVKKRVPGSSLVLAQNGGTWDTVAIGEDHATASIGDRVLRAIAAGANTADEVRIALGSGDRRLPERTLYDALRRLRNDGYLEGGSPFVLTASGREAAE